MTRIGPHEVLSEIGRGGFGVVYRARGPDGRDLAIKVLRATAPETLARFARETRLHASLGEQSGFVPVLDAGTAGAQAFLVMPFLPGGTLRDRLGRGALAIDEVVALGRSLARALGEAHARGIVHRDVKPENVLYGADGRPLLADLGLAKHFDPLAAGASQSIVLSKSGSFRGSPGYMSPEQIDDAARVGPPANVFALGCVLHECLTGRPTFPGDTPVELLTRLSEGRFEPVRFARPDAPRWLANAVDRALAKDPARRFADGAGLARALEATTSERSRAGPAAFVAGVAIGALACWLLVGARGPAPQPAAPPAPPPHAAPTLGTPQADVAAAIARARARLESGDLDGALADATHAVELAPRTAAAWHTRGRVHSTRGELQQCLDDETRAIELDPCLAGAYVERGRVRMQLTDTDGAMEDVTRAIELAPEIASAWATRGYVRHFKGDEAGAIADLTRAIELSPKVAMAWFNRGLARGALGDVQAEIEDETRAIELDPKLELAWHSRGVARRKKGDVDGAIEDLTRAIELGLALALKERGHVLSSKGDVSGARADYTRFLKLVPKEPDAPAIRDWLSKHP